MLFGYTPFMEKAAGIFVCALKSTVAYEGVKLSV